MRLSFVPRQQTWNEALSKEWNGSLVCAEAQDESFEIRKQHLLTSYFGLSSTKELKNDLVNYQHTSTSLTIDCAAIVNCRFWFVTAYIDVLVVTKFSNGMILIVIMK